MSRGNKSPDLLTSIKFDHIPLELQSLKQWSLWCWGQDPEKTKRTKVPKFWGPHGLTSAKSNDPETWSTFEETKARYLNTPEAFGGIMLALTPQDPFIFVDLDNAVDKKDGIKPWAREIIDQLRSYTELSVSGTGVHIIGRGNKDKKWTKSGHAKSKVCRTTYQDGEVEVYDEKRFVIFTGQIVLPERPITDSQTGLETG